MKSDIFFGQCMHCGYDGLEQDTCTLRIGKFDINMGTTSSDKIWIFFNKNDKDNYGEGEEFNIIDFEMAIEKFYKEKS